MTSSKSKLDFMMIPDNQQLMLNITLDRLVYLDKNFNIPNIITYGWASIYATFELFDKPSKINHEMNNVYLKRSKRRANVIKFLINSAINSLNQVSRFVKHIKMPLRYISPLINMFTNMIDGFDLIQSFSRYIKPAPP